MRTFIQNDDQHCGEKSDEALVNQNIIFMPHKNLYIKYGVIFLNKKRIFFQNDLLKHFL